MLRVFLAVFLGLGLSHCDDDDVRPERIDKLRAIGIVPAASIIANPAVGQVTPVTATVYAAAPAGVTLDDVSAYSDPRPGTDLGGGVLQIDQSSLNTEDLGALQMFSVNVAVTVPSLPEALIDGLNGVARVRYGITMRAGEESENIIADLLVVKPGDEALTWQPPEIALVEPGDTGLPAGTNTPLLATVDKFTDETIKVQWFVSAGQVANPVSRDTEWEETTSGEHTVIFAAYPRRSRASRIVYKKVVIP